MKTESNGEPTAAETQITRGLARLYSEELDRAERDFPTMRTPLWDADERHQPRRRMKLRLAGEAVGIVAVAAILVGGGWLAANPQSGPGGPAASMALGADGIPVQIDGEHVYRVGEAVPSQMQGGYLLGGYVFQEIAVNCPVDTVPQSTCFGLGPTAGSDVFTGGIDVIEAHDVSDPNPYSLGSWLGAPIVASMKGCTWDNGTPCPPVVMAIVWPTVPTEVAGEKVYRATNKASFPTSGSFLLGGRFSKPDFVPPCPAPIDKTAAERQLLPYCYLQSIDGLDVSPMSSIDEPNHEMVVARVHVDDPLAAQCPASAQAECKAAIVVESVVWRSDFLVNTVPTPVPAGPGAAASPGTSTTLVGPSTGTGAGTEPPPPNAIPSASAQRSTTLPSSPEPNAT